MLAALECLKIEIDTNWIRNERGRLHAERVPEPRPGSAPYLLWAASDKGSLLEVGSAVPTRTAEHLYDVYQRQPARHDPAAPPPGADRYIDIATREVGPSVVARVPCFVIDSVSSFEMDPGWSKKAELVRSRDGCAVPRCASMPTTHIDERRGPWAGVAVDGQLVSACSTARSSPRGAEAGTWTDPAYRGQGFAAAATAGWASMLLSEGRVLFYCTDEWNRSSRAVARRLDLTPIGWMWRLDPPSPT